MWTAHCEKDLLPKWRLTCWSCCAGDEALAPIKIRFSDTPLGASCLKQCVNMIERDRLKVERRNLSASYRRSLRDRQSKLYLFPRDSFEKKSSICSATADHSLVARFAFLSFFSQISRNAVMISTITPIINSTTWYYPAPSEVQKWLIWGKEEGQREEKRNMHMVLFQISEDEQKVSVK